MPEISAQKSPFEFLWNKFTREKYIFLPVHVIREEYFWFFPKKTNKKVHNYNDWKKLHSQWKPSLKNPGRKEWNIFPIFKQYTSVHWSFPIHTYRAATAAAMFDENRRERDAGKCECEGFVVCVKGRERKMWMVKREGVHTHTSDARVRSRPSAIIM